MRFLAILVIAAVTGLASTPALAQESTASPLPTENESHIRVDGATLGILSTTPTRIASSAREMNRDRATNWALSPTPSQLRTFAERSLRRGGFQCTVAEVELVAQLLDKTPIVEVVCEENGGLIIADSRELQFSDCLDLANATGPIGPCRLARNVALVNAARQ